MSDRPVTPRTPRDITDDTIKRVFLVTLTPDTDPANSGYVFLPDVYGELSSSGKTLTFTKDLVDSVVVERLNKRESSCPTLYEFLFGCYVRVEERMRDTRFKNDPDKMSLLLHIHDLVVSYVCLVLQFADTFEQPEQVQQQGVLQLLPHLKENWSNRVFSKLVTAILKHLEGQSPTGPAEFFCPILVRLTAEMRTVSMLDSFLPSYLVLKGLLDQKCIAGQFGKLLDASAPWMPAAITGQSLEGVSFLGPFFRITSLPEDQKVAEHFFSGITTRTQASVDANLKNIRENLNSVTTIMGQVVMSLFKGGPETKDATLQWLWSVVNANRGRKKMMQNDPTVSRDGFLMNITTVVLELCKPFIDDAPNKMKLIDPLFALSKKRYDLKDDTRLVLSGQERDAAVQRNASKEDAFTLVTDLFFMALHLMEVGPLSSLERYMKILKHIQDRNHAVRELEQTRSQWMNSPQAAMNEAILQRAKSDFDNMLMHKFACDAQLLNPAFLDLAARFYGLVAKWLVERLLGCGEDPQLPLAGEPSEVWGLQSESTVESINTFLLHLGRLAPGKLVSVLESTPSLATLMVVGMRSSSHFKNPYLRAHLAEVLFVYCESCRGDKQPARLLDTHPLCRRELARSLTEVYVDVEHCGDDSGFYQKFNIRYYLTQIFGELWKNPHHKEILRNLSEAEPHFYSKFVALILSDAVWLLDEALNQLAEIRKAQLKLENPAEMAAMSQQDREVFDTNFRQNERLVQSSLLLGNHSVHFLNYMTKDVKAAFLRDETVERLAHMLNFYLVALVGPKCLDLKVKNAEKYHFDPKKLLQEITDVYTHLGLPDTGPDYAKFVNAVANDGRSFKIEVFHKAISIMRQHVLKGEGDIRRFEEFASLAESASKQVAAQEEDYGEIPEEFLDPVYFTLMDDPVILPSSNVTVDRAIITRHLLTESFDPFNRSALTVDELIPNTDLKRKIDEWKASKARS